MTGPLDTWDKAAAFALTLSDTAYGAGEKSGVIVTTNGRAFMFPGREAATSFVVTIDLDTIEMLKETEPETYWQSKHYQNWPGILIRYDSPDPERVRHVIEMGYEYTRAKKPVRKRKT
ncbi:hypothetical protein GRI89_00315 [Altererythrobacter salegens]|uniref:YjbR protein n=1 Tax=Croceibacterium salegens TaxID=1737568 RepID=A0A6I4SSB6_9SPHN|nr:hypothetical protein [Croceibacterium salegens]MXO57990.1 hypothetical protein [Croceibacterium salegens]